MSESDRWGCPDWRDVGAYPAHHTDLEEWRWKWEFLRRLPEYRKLWIDREKPEVIDGFFWGGELRDKFELEIPIPDPREALEVMPFENYGGQDFYLPPRKWLEERWKKDLEKFSPVDVLEHIAKYLFVHGLTNDPDTNQKVFIQFDISRPLNFQLKIAKKQLHTLQDQFDISSTANPKLYGKQREPWPRHLRIIDAQDQGATDTEIFNKFHAELEGDIEAYDKFGGEQPLVMIADWRKAALATMEKAAHYL